MEYFSRREFACKCGCGFDTVDYELADALDDVRKYFGASVRVTSGCRCESHNANVGGSAKSKHIAGRAADFVLSDIAPGRVANYLEAKYPGKYGIGRYGGWTHLDTRTDEARWG